MIFASYEVTEAQNQTATVCHIKYGCPICLYSTNYGCLISFLISFLYSTNYGCLISLFLWVSYFIAEIIYDFRKL